jgi:ATP-dependent helicase/nuclease subunit A
MYVIGARGGRGSFPFDLLPVEEFPEGEPPEPAPAEARAEERVSGVAHEAPLLRVEDRREQLSYAERRRGTLVHLALALLGTPDDLVAAAAEAGARAKREMRATDAEDLPDLAARLRSLGLEDAFAERPGRAVFTEREFCDARGRVHRMDRLVVDPDRVLVLDWKTGEEEIGTPQQEAQVRAYADILRQVFPGRAVEAKLVHLDRGETRSVA